jgi:topoisomerase-4 subunit B
VSFVPDPELFGDYAYNEDFIISRLWSYAYLNTGLTLDYNNKIYKSAHGLLDLLEKEVGSENLYTIIHYQAKQLEFSLTHVAGSYGENYFSYVNGQHTTDGGTHQSAFKEGILKGINEHFKKNWAPQDVPRGLWERCGEGEENGFRVTDEKKLSNTEIRIWIVNEVRTPS